MGFLFHVDVGLVQGHNHGNTQLQKLGGEEQAAAEVGGVHDVDDHVGALVPDIGAGDALVGGEGGHGVGAGQIHSRQLCVPRVNLLNKALFFVHGNTRPVTDGFVTARQGVVHGRFSRIRVSCQCNFHLEIPPEDGVC